jgi:hypothetical protein
MPFQRQVNINQAPGFIGAIASMNPIATIVAGPGGLVAGTGGVAVGRFAWNTYPNSASTTISGNPGQATNQCLTGRVPDGFIGNLQEGLITIWLNDSTLIVPVGYGVTEYNRGDFWAQNNMSDAPMGAKVFANLLDGQVTSGVPGAFLTQAPGSAAAGSATLVLGSYTVIITANTTGTFAPGQIITGAGIPPDTAIESGTIGATGTFQMSAPATIAGTGVAVIAVALEGNGGATCSSVTGGTGSPNLTINAVPVGSLYVGQLVQNIAGIAAGTYISGLGTWNGATGYVVLSANPTATITAQACNFTPWIETSWFVKSVGNIGDLIKIGVV